MLTFSEWMNLETASINKNWWGYEVSGTIPEVLVAMKKAPPNRECIATIDIGHDLHGVLNDEFIGSVAEVTGKLQAALSDPRTPKNAECVASIGFRRHGSKSPRPSMIP